MKNRIFIIVLIALIILILTIMLTSCTGGELNGTYRSQGLIAQSLTFDKGNKITMTAFGINASGTYKISDGKMTVTYTVLGIDTSWSYDYKRKGKSIFVNGAEFIKQ